MADNILLLTDDIEDLNSLRRKINLKRQEDYINIISSPSLKNISKSAEIIFINGAKYKEEEILKQIDLIKKIAPKCKIILLNSNLSEEFLINAYNKGLHEAITPDISDTNLHIHIMNCLKTCKLEKINEVLNIFINTSGTMDYKTSLYSKKALKECFSDLDELSRIQNGVFCVLTLDKATKTKVSNNRLAVTLKKNLRSTDIIAYYAGKYYIILCGTGLEGAQNAVQKIADLMGEEIQLRAGLCKIGIGNFENIESKAQDLLQSSVIKNLIFDCGYEDVISDNEEVKNPVFKLFNKSFENKLNNIIKPLFFRFGKDTEMKFKDANIIQYANDVESVFCIKNAEFQSELIIRYNGITNLNLIISHSGLESPETTNIDIALNKFNDKILTKYLKQLVQEYKEGVKNA